MPVIYFKWIIDKYQGDEVNNIINLHIQILSFCMAYGEAVQVVQLNYNGLKVGFRIASLIQSTGSLFIQLNEEVQNELLQTENGRDFLNYWNSAGVIFNVSSGIEDLCSDKWPLFILIKTYWERMSETEKDIISTTEREKIQQVVNAINNELLSD